MQNIESVVKCSGLLGVLELVLPCLSSRKAASVLVKVQQKSNNTAVMLKCGVALSLNQNRTIAAVVW